MKSDFAAQDFVLPFLGAVDFAALRSRWPQIAATCHRVVRRGDRKNSRESTGRVPRVAKLMALAIRFDQLIRDGIVTDQAELARIGHMSRARLTQIMNLPSLASEIQEEILLQPMVECGLNALTEKRLRPIVGVLDWRKQRQMWHE